MIGKASLIPFQAVHLTMFKPQEEQQALFDIVPSKEAKIHWGQSVLKSSAIIRGEVAAYTALDPKGKVIGCGGVIQLQGHVGEAWLLLAEGFKKHAKYIIPILKSNLYQSDFLRLQATHETAFPRGGVLLRMLGFEHEATLKRASRDQGDQEMYSIIRDDKGE